jgi:glycosyltransferase involved in cell wall biosynthesis
MNVWLITVGEPLPLPGNESRLWRTGLLARELTARGHTVRWWTSTVNHFTKTLFRGASEAVPVDDRLTLEFLHGPLYTRNISWQRLRNHREIAAEFDRHSAELPRPDVVLCSFPTIELSAAAVRFARRTGVPVALDIRDLWPDEIEARFPRSLRWAAPLLLSGMEREARAAMGGADSLIGISRKYLDWGLAHAGRALRAADQVFAHGYPRTEPLPAAVQAGELERLRLLGVDPGKRIFWFAGTFVNSIDLATVIRCAATLRDRADIQFVFCGSGEKDAEWRALAAGAPNVVFTGWAESVTLATMGAIAWAGLGAYKAGALMSLTNKLFEYMNHRLPILLSLDGEARALVEGNGAGLYYAAGDPDSLRQAVLRVADDPALRADLAARSLALFDGAYSAEAVYRRYADHLESLSAGAQALHLAS